MKKQLLLTFIILLCSTKLFFAQTGVITTTVVQQPCNGDGIIAINIAGMIPPYKIQYSNNGMFGGATHLNIHASNDTLKNISPRFSYWTSGYSISHASVFVIDSLGATKYANIVLNAPFIISVNTAPAIYPMISGSGTVSFSSASNYSVEWLTAWQSPINTVAIGNPASLLPGAYDVRVTDLNSGCVVTTFSTNINVGLITGINDEQFITGDDIQDFSIYPNPANDVLNINYGASLGKIKITDIVGNIIYYSDCMSQINMAPFEKGIYFLNLYKNSKLIGIKKFIKQ